MVGTVEVGPAGPDVVAPTTTASVVPQNNAAMVRLSATDGTRPGKTGVAYVDYVVNGALPADGGVGPGVTRLTNAGGADPFVSEISLTAPGTYTIQYRAVDGAGNREAVKSETVRLEPVTDPPGGPQLNPLPGPLPPAPGPKPQTPKADIGASLAKRTVTATRRATRASFRVQVRNTGTAASGTVRVCADLATKSAKQRLAISGAKCRTVTVAAGTSRSVSLAVRIKGQARGKTTPVRVRVSGSGMQTKTLTVKVRVRS
jgi:hypothetical protein